MPVPKGWDDPKSLELARSCVAQELKPGTALPSGEDEHPLVVFVAPGLLFGATYLERHS